MIETMLFSLPSAYKGTIYTIGRHPDLIAKRITSGIIDSERHTISWGLPEISGYNPPGRPWSDYRDDAERPLEAMAWCVEKQKSWTAVDPTRDVRSVRMQVEGVHEDCHHMEPVLVRKSDLHFDLNPPPDYARDSNGNILWKDYDYVVVAVIKIHFQSQSIRLGSAETKVIKRLSRSLGTELLSYKLRRDSLTAMQQVAKDRLNACNILADSLRNAITKSGLIFSLIKMEIGNLRDRWEDEVLDDTPQRITKKRAIEDLNKALLNLDDGCGHLCKDLINVQNRFLELALPPDKGEQWIIMQIEERWKAIFNVFSMDEEKTKSIWGTINRLKDSLRFGQDPDIIGRYDKIPEEEKKAWVDLLYENYDRYNSATLERLIELLSSPNLKISSRERSRKMLIQLRALADTMNQLERNTNFLLRQVLNGGSNGLIEEILGRISTE